ncbi:hypothetical protein CEK68_11720 [Xanthomonas sp. LMG 12461]|nr:hypothetical protein CEK68_11720 [Xanthomonas sp. LMG 12461]
MDAQPQAEQQGAWGALAAFVRVAARRKAELGELSPEMDKCLRDGVEALAARQPVDPAWSLHDRVEFALRDAGFDLSEASRIAAAADNARQPVGEPIGTVHNGNLVWLPDAHAPNGSWLYTTPPAAVDLSFLRLHCAGRIKEADRDRLSAGHGGDERGQALANAKRKAYEDVLGLIDGKAARS